jgi:ATP-dependent Clp protease ATP-binding subunit ClpC
MFNRFDNQARQAMVSAREESDGDAIDTAHLLCGIIAVGGRTSAVLQRAGVSLEAVRAARGDGESGEHGPLTLELRECLEAALADSLAAGDAAVSCTHLLTAALADPASRASAVLRTLGVDPRTLTDEGPRRASAGRTGRVRERVLDTLGTDLTEAAAEGSLDPVLGRDAEIEAVLVTLGRRSKPNPVLLGEAGVGKTAVVEGVAQRIASGAVPEDLRNTRIITLDLGALIAGTKLRGELEERAKKAIAEACEAGDVLFIDEIHTLVGAGSSRDSGLDLGQIMKPYLARGELRVIGATTNDEWRAMRRDQAMERRFTPVRVDPLRRDAAVIAAASAARLLEEHHRVRFSPEAVEAAVDLAAQHIVDRNLPDSAIDVLDEAGAAAAMWRISENAAATAALGREEIASVVAEMTGIDVRSITTERAARLAELETRLVTTVIGQPEAADVVSRAARRSGAGLSDPTRPVANFLFCGPSGVGKTMTAKLLAEAFFGDEGAITQFDMSEYPEAHDVARLLGAPPGYAGYREGGQLIEAIRRRRAQVLLFDEVEKAHPRVYDVLLGLLEEGRVRGGDGRVADARGCVVVLTSNLGSERSGRSAGFSDGRGGRGAGSSVRDAMAKFFRPELLNRIDTTVVFNPLGRTELVAIAHRELAELAARVRERGLVLAVTDGVAEELARLAGGEAGARGVRRAVEREIEDRIATGVLAGSAIGASVVRAELGLDGIVLCWEASTDPVSVQ